jgi:hypothetical protein
MLSEALEKWKMWVVRVMSVIGRNLHVTTQKLALGAQAIILVFNKFKVLCK